MLSNNPRSLRNTAATTHLSTLSHSDISAWTDGLVLVGWGRVVQGSTLSVQSVSLPPSSPSRMDSGPPATVPRPMPIFRLLSGVSHTPRHVR